MQRFEVDTPALSATGEAVQEAAGPLATARSALERLQADGYAADNPDVANAVEAFVAGWGRSSRRCTTRRSASAATRSPPRTPTRRPTRPRWAATDGAHRAGDPRRRGRAGHARERRTDLKSIGGVLDGAAGELSGRAQPAGWLGSAAVMYGEQCVTQGSAAQAGGNAMSMAAGHLSTLAGALVASVGGPGRAPGVAPLPPLKPPPEPEHHGGIGGFIHGALDAAGFIPVVGAAADGANAIYYAAEGDEVNAAFSAAAAVPVVGDAAAAGKLVYKGGKAIKAAEEADEGIQAAKDVNRIYSRPSGFRKGVRDKVWTSAEDPVTGEVRDPVTQTVKESAAERGITREQFLDEHNDPSHYRPELPSSNRRHAGEDQTDTWLGP